MSVNTSKIYEELLKLNINLDFENIPTPAYIQARIIECDQYQRKVEKYALQVQQEMTLAERLLKTEKLSIESKKRNTLTSNESIKKLPTGKEREAAVDELLEDDYHELLKLENSFCGLKDLMSSIKTVQYNLRSTFSSIKMLQKNMETQVNRLSVGSPDDPEVKDLHNSMSEIDEMEREEEMTLDDVESSEEYLEPGEEDESESGPIEMVDPETDSSEPEIATDIEDDGVSAFLEEDSPEIVEESDEVELVSIEESGSEESTEAKESQSKETEVKEPAASTSSDSSDVDLSELGIDIEIDGTDTDESDQTAEVEVETPEPAAEEPIVEEIKKETVPANSDDDIDINSLLSSLDG